MEHNFIRHSVLPQESDASKRITLSALGFMLLNAAGIDAESKGFGSIALFKDNKCWVVSRMAIEMKRYPTMYEEITIETWVEDFTAATTTRNFRVHDASDEIIGEGSTLWAIIDMNTRRAVNLLSYPEWATFATGETVAMEKPHKVGAADEEVERYRVRYSDIDFNQHTNSMKYVEWMLNTLDISQMQNHIVTRFDINYMREARFGQEVSICRCDDDDTNRFELKDADNKSLCRAELKWN